MDKSILNINNLSIKYKNNGNYLTAVNNIDLNIDRGEKIGIMGESGSGKTSLGLAIMGILPNNTETSGEIYYKGTEILNVSEEEKNKFRWSKIAMVFQNGLEVLNPVLTIHDQIYECIVTHTNLEAEMANIKVKSLLTLVGLEIQEENCYPHQLSGGMRQKVLIAMALSCEPDVLIMDEPTSSLDEISKKEIIAFINKLYKEKRFTLIVISHDIETITKLTNRVNIMYKGYILEEGMTSNVIYDPMHTYTKGLVNSSPYLNPYRDLWGIPGEIENNDAKGCPFYSRCNQKIEDCKRQIPKLCSVGFERKVACIRGGIVSLLYAKDICKIYQVKDNKIKACDKCEIEIYFGEIAVLIGKSGSGKSTLSNILCGVNPPDRGEIFFEGEKIKGNNATCKMGGMQIVFQDPFSSVNEQFTVEQAIKEPLDICKIGSIQERKERVQRVLRNVELSCEKEFLEKRCYMLSGGQRQRVAIARSLIMEPKLLIADEISSMLDPSTQANILRLLKGLQNEKGFAMIYVTHDLSIAQKIADSIYVMKDGRITKKCDTVVDVEYNVKDF